MTNARPDRKTLWMNRYHQELAEGGKPMVTTVVEGRYMGSKGNSLKSRRPIDFVHQNIKLQGRRQSRQEPRPSSVNDPVPFGSRSRTPYSSFLKSKYRSPYSAEATARPGSTQGMLNHTNGGRRPTSAPTYRTVTGDSGRSHSRSSSRRPMSASSRHSTRAEQILHCRPSTPSKSKPSPLHEYIVGVVRDEHEHVMNDIHVQHSSKGKQHRRPASAPLLNRSFSNSSKDGFRYTFPVETPHPKKGRDSRIAMAVHGNRTSIDYTPSRQFLQSSPVDHRLQCLPVNYV